MSDVKRVDTARSGVKYRRTELRRGPLAVTKAVLALIPHETQPAALSLKLGRYKCSPFGEAVEIGHPKSELTLGAEEFQCLLSFLRESVDPLLAGVTRYITVDDDEVPVLFDRFRQYLQDADREQALRLIEEYGLLPDHLLAAVTARRRNDAVAEFDQMLADDAAEAEWQGWFTRNAWVLGSDYVRVLDERRVDVKNIADYLVEAYDGHLDVVEIKRPSLPFWADALDHKNRVPSTDLVKAMTQAQNYQFELEREMNSQKMQERVRVPIAKPRSLLIFGTSADWAKDRFRAQRLLNAGLTSVQILTYDQVLRRARKMLAPPSDAGTMTPVEPSTPDPFYAENEDPFGDQ